MGRCVVLVVLLCFAACVVGFRGVYKDDIGRFDKFTSGLFWCCFFSFFFFVVLLSFVSGHRIGRHHVVVNGTNENHPTIFINEQDVLFSRQKDSILWRTSSSVGATSIASSSHLIFVARSSSYHLSLLRVSDGALVSDLFQSVFWVGDSHVDVNGDGVLDVVAVVRNVADDESVSWSVQIMSGKDASVLQSHFSPLVVIGAVLDDRGGLCGVVHDKQQKHLSWKCWTSNESPRQGSVADSSLSQDVVSSRVKNVNVIEFIDTSCKVWSLDVTSALLSSRIFGSGGRGEHWAPKSVWTKCHVSKKTLETNVPQRRYVFANGSLSGYEGNSELWSFGAGSLKSCVGEDVFPKYHSNTYELNKKLLLKSSAVCYSASHANNSCTVYVIDGFDGRVWGYFSFKDCFAQGGDASVRIFGNTVVFAYRTRHVYVVNGIEMYENGQLMSYPVLINAPLAPSSMVLARSRQGITSPVVVMATKANKVVYIPWYVLVSWSKIFTNSSNVSTPPPIEMADVLVASNHHNMVGLEDVSFEVSSLESEIVINMNAFDHYRVSLFPSGRFDAVLDKTPAQKIALVVVMVALGVVAVFTSYLRKQQPLRQRWY